MRRREFISGVAGTAAAWPLTAMAQQRALPVIGFLGSETPAIFAERLNAFRKGLSDIGYFEGRNVAIEFLWTEGHYDRLPGLATELVRKRVNVMATTGGAPTALAAKAATTTIPIVFHLGSNPVDIGLVASLSRPGANITGVTAFNVELCAKRLELIHQLVPTVTRFALLTNPTNSVGRLTNVTDLQTAAGKLGLETVLVRAGNESELDAAFASLAELGAGAVVISPDPYFIARSGKLSSFALRSGVPAIHSTREYTVAGGVMSYGSSLTDSSRQTGIYTGRILNGEKPADLPVMQAAKFELIVNLKTAKALGLTVPPMLLARADEVIE